MTVYVTYHIVDSNGSFITCCLTPWEAEKELKKKRRNLILKLVKEERIRIYTRDKIKQFKYLEKL